MRTEKLIQDLCQGLEPVKVHPSPRIFALRVASLCVFCVVASAFLYAPREDFLTQLISPAFVIELLMAAAIAAIAAIWLSTLVIPGRNQKSLMPQGWIVFTAGLLAIHELIRILPLSKDELGAGMSTGGVHCSYLVIGVTALASLGIGILARTGAPTRPRLFGLAIAMAALGAGIFAVTIYCDFDNGMHSGLWHVFLPLALASGLSFALGKIVFRW